MNVTIIIDIAKRMRSENGAVRGSEIQRANSDDVSKDEIGYLLTTRSDEPHSFAQVKGHAHFSECQFFFLVRSVLGHEAPTFQKRPTVSEEKWIKKKTNIFI